MAPYRHQGVPVVSQRSCPQPAVVVGTLRETFVKPFFYDGRQSGLELRHAERVIS